MPDKRVYIIKNTLNLTCHTCGGKHDYISQSSDHARCGTPVGMPKDLAILQARSLNLPDDAVILAPDNVVVVLHSRARKLRQQSGQAVPMEQIQLQPRPM